MLGLDFNEERDKGKLKEDKNFEGSVFQKMGLSKYLCPECNTHLKESGKDIICLNGCHLPKQWVKRFTEKIKKGVA